MVMRESIPSKIRVVSYITLFFILIFTCKIHARTPKSRGFLWLNEPVLFYQPKFLLILVVFRQLEIIVSEVRYPKVTIVFLSCSAARLNLKPTKTTIKWVPVIKWPQRKVAPFIPFAAWHSLVRIHWLSAWILGSDCRFFLFISFSLCVQYITSKAVTAVNIKTLVWTYY